MRQYVTVVLLIFLSISVNYGLSKEEFGYSDIYSLLQIGGNVQITPIKKTATFRNFKGNLDDDLENFIKSNEISMDIPFGSAVAISGRNLDNGELDLKLKLDHGDQNVEARKKGKIKKIIGPILIVLLLKSITLIPLALGILGIKTWNALQLSFVAFVTSLVLTVWKICSKFAEHPPAPHVIHEAVHDPWDHSHHYRSDNAQEVAYNAYVPDNRM